MQLGRVALGHRRINRVGVKDMTAALATKVVGQSLVDRCTDRRTSCTACGTAK